MRKEALQILDAALRAVDPVEAIKRHVRIENKDRLAVGDRIYNLKDYQRILVIGGGKASGSMARAVEEILGDRITAGIVNTTEYGCSEKTSIIKLNEARHPIPDKNGVKGVREMIGFLKEAGKKDLVICLVSGGGSALMPLPAEGITLEDKRKVTNLLLKSGATINEINVVRKHISQIKGGQLARIAYPAELVTLILSDAVGDLLDTIASGPTVPDSSTFEEAYTILVRYNLWGDVPDSVRQHILRGQDGLIPETPKRADSIFKKTYNLIVGNNETAICAAAKKAKELGFNTSILSTFIEGEAREVAKVFSAIAKEIVHSGSPIPKKACVVAGGETTVTVRGKGKGGRNQELALSAAIEIEGLENVIIVSLATDGKDGPLTDAAGGMVDGYTIKRARAKGLDPLRHLDNNDSYNLLKQVGGLIITGPTNTNVNDLIMILAF